MYVMKKGKDCLFIIEESSRKIVESYDFSEYREALDDLNELNNQQEKEFVFSFLLAKQGWRNINGKPVLVPLEDPKKHIKKIKAIDIEVAKEKLFEMFNGMQIRNIHTLKTV